MVHRCILRIGLEVPNFNTHSNALLSITISMLKGTDNIYYLNLFIAQYIAKTLPQYKSRARSYFYKILDANSITFSFLSPIF